jgi:hypothetical protein
MPGLSETANLCGSCAGACGTLENWPQRLNRCAAFERKVFRAWFSRALGRREIDLLARATERSRSHSLPNIVKTYGRGGSAPCFAAAVTIPADLHQHTRQISPRCQ